MDAASHSSIGGFQMYAGLPCAEPCAAAPLGGIWPGTRRSMTPPKPPVACACAPQLS